jgi:hypothetical protein
MKTAVFLYEEGALYRLYRADTAEDADKFAALVGAQSVTHSGQTHEILVLKRGYY